MMLKSEVMRGTRMQSPSLRRGCINHVTVMCHVEKRIVSGAKKRRAARTKDGHLSE
jgi:hypothetical protein